MASSSSGIGSVPPTFSSFDDKESPKKSKNKRSFIPHLNLKSKKKDINVKKQQSSPLISVRSFFGASSSSSSSTSSASSASSSVQLSWKESWGVVMARIPNSAFLDLQLEKLIAPGSHSLNSIFPYFPVSDFQLLEGITFQDPSINYRGEPVLIGDVDASFLPLQNLQKQTEPSKIGGAFLNTYPILCSVPVLINCDAYRVERYACYKLAVVADGCGLGSKPRKAAQQIVSATVNCVNRALRNEDPPINTAEDLARVLIYAFAVAHEATLDQCMTTHDAGTSTVAVSLGFSDQNGQNYLIVASLGDCKTIVVSQNAEQELRAVEVKHANHIRLDTTDPGGRLGPYVSRDFSQPDLRNLFVSCVPVSEGDIVLTMTDGVHDNFNPENLGYSPHEIDPSYPPEKAWSELDEAERMLLHEKFQYDRLISLIKAATQTGCQDLNVICGHIVKYCFETTEPSRTFLEANPTRPEPKDRKEYPGKMDHCSLTAFQI